MCYEVIFEKENYALILRGSKMNEYAVVYGLNKGNQDWAYTCYYCPFGRIWYTDKTAALSSTLDYFRMKTETNYIPRCRLEELATQFKDRLIEDDEESAMEYFNEVCEMSDSEKEFFGIETESEEE